MFELQGTPAQQELVRRALSRCTFPFERLAPKLKTSTGRDRLPVEWADLSRYAGEVEGAAKKEEEKHG